GPPDPRGHRGVAGADASSSRACHSPHLPPTNTLLFPSSPRVGRRGTSDSESDTLVRVAEGWEPGPRAARPRSACGVGAARLTRHRARLASWRTAGGRLRIEA